MFIQFVIIVLCFLSTAIQATGLFPEQMVIQERTDHIYHRYYLIKRLEPSLQLLHNDQVQKCVPFERLDATLFRLEAIQSAVECMSQKKTMMPLFDLWHMFCSYRYVDSLIFKNEFIELIYYICDLIEPLHKKYRGGICLEQKLCCIDQVTDTLRYGASRSHIMVHKDIDEVGTNLVARRFFIIKRLHKSMQFLAYLHEKKQYPLAKSDNIRSAEESVDLLDEIEHFSNDHMRDCIIQMCQKKSLDPLLRVCNEFKQYRFASDDSFLQEMLMNIFLVYKSLLFKNLSDHAEQVIMTEMSQVLEIYEHIDSLPLDETLQAIDMVTDKLIAIQALESKNDKKYLWAIIPGILSTALGFGAYYYLTK
ncbi:MAG: hypothetical protein WD055_05940 [Candidatus Dependentiae bacterium]